MKRILYIAYTSPLAPTSGFSYRTNGILQWLLDRFSITLIFQGSLQDLSNSFLPLERFERIQIVPVDSSILQKALGVFGKLPYHHALYCHQAMRDRIHEMVQNNIYDLIWLNKSVHFPVLESIKTLPKIIIDQIAAEPHVWDNMISKDPRWYARSFFKWNKWKVLRYDQKVYKRVAGVICITKADQEITKQYYPDTRTIYIPQGVDPLYYSPDQQTSSDQNLLLFSGTGAVRNLQAVKNLIREVMPLVHQQCPDMRLLWIGNVERAKHSFLRPPWIGTTGFVQHTPPYFNRGMIYVAPFDMGEGMKTKIVEAMAMAKVIVSTPVGVHGIDVKNLPFVKVCSDFNTFAEAIITFRENPNLKELGKLARDHAVKHYTWDHVLKPLNGFLAECIRS